MAPSSLSYEKSQICITLRKKESCPISWKCMKMQLVDRRSGRTVGGCNVLGYWSCKLIIPCSADNAFIESRNGRPWSKRSENHKTDEPNMKYLLILVESNRTVCSSYHDPLSQTLIFISLTSNYSYQLWNFTNAQPCCGIWISGAGNCTRINWNRTRQLVGLWQYFFEAIAHT